MPYRRRSTGSGRQNPSGSSRSGRTSSSRSSSRRTSSGSSSTALQRRKKRRKRIKPLPIVVLIIVIIIICASAFSKNAVEVFVDDTSIGYVKGNTKKITASDLETTVTSQISQQIGTEIRLNEEITAKSAHASKKNMVTTDSIISKLKDNVTYKVKAAVVYVDGEEIGVLSSENEANKFLEGFASQYVSEEANLKDWEFTRDVSVKEAYVDKDKIVTTDTIRVKFMETRLEPATYVVQSGDALYGIADKLGTTYSQMMGDNPNLPQSLYAGQELNILLPQPYISVRTIEETEEVVVVPKETETQVDDTKSSDYKKIVQQGSDGERKIVTQVTKVNGLFESESIVSDTVTKQPVNDIIVVGK